MLRINAEDHATFIFATHDPLVMEQARRQIQIKDGMVQTDNILMN